MQSNPTTFPIWFGLDVSKETFTAAKASIVRDDPISHSPQAHYAINAMDVRKFMQWVREISGEFKF